MKKTVSLFALFLRSFATVAAASSQTPYLQFHRAFDKPAPNTKPMALIHKSKSGERKETVYVQKTIRLDETDVKSAKMLSGQYGIQIAINFTDKGKKLFAKFTHESLHKRIAIIIDGKLYSAPVVLEEIDDGVVWISGSFTKKEAKNLAAKISSPIKKK